MSLPKFFLLVIVVLFSAIGLAYFKKQKSPNYEREVYVAPSATSVPIDLEDGAEMAEGNSSLPPLQDEAQVEIAPARGPDDDLPDANRVAWFFNTGEPKLPIVKTLVYKSKVPWLKERPAWVSDYAGHYRTSRHFIARSLNGRPDYFNQNVANGDRLNVLDPDQDIRFHLVCDVNRMKMWFYYHEAKSNERILIRTYDVGLGRVAGQKASGLLTPLGTYTLGEKVAVYKPKMMGWFNKERMEMVQVFGTRWIPFEKEVTGCTEPAKGFGLHGVPWKPIANGELTEERDCIGRYSSDGCVRLHTDDMEELFSIIITKQTQIHLVRDFREAKLPGVEKTL